MHTTTELQYELVHDKHDYPFSILLQADETIDAINRYVYESAVYVVKAGAGTVAAFCLYVIDANTIELKNIAVIPSYRNGGVGSKILSFIKELHKEKYQRVIVGVADAGCDQIRFYKRNGFRYYDTRADFYLINYPEPLYENGEQLKDMLLFEYIY